MSSYHSEAALPAPDAEAVAHSEALIRRIVERIEQAEGALPFDAYMQACLYEPGLGYYSSGSVKLGAQGDFVTAPEISPLFGHTLARHAHALFEQGLPPALLEFGAGSGRLCRDLLQALTGGGRAIERYCILETSADLRQRQQSLLRDALPDELFARIEWLDALPRDFEGLVLGNELLDAMPVKVLLKQQGWQELGVGFEQGRFVWKALSPERQSAEALEAMRLIDRNDRLPEGYATEVNLNFRPWSRSLHDSCGRAAVLLIDYGYRQRDYYHPSRSSGTLQCFFRHRVHGDPFVYPGLQDITAFVDFDAFADVARQAGFCLGGLATQAEFLLRNGLLELELEPARDEADALAQLQRSRQIQTLTLPGEMGEKFKCIGLLKDIELSLPGLSG